MAEGDSTYMGLAVPLSGEAEIKQIPGDEAVDILTITGSTGTQTGDFIVAQSGAGTEVFVVSASGAVSVTAGISGLTSAAVTLSSTAASYGINVAVTSTGAIAAGSITNNAILVSMSSKANLNAVIGFSSGGGSEVGQANTFFAVHGSKAPTYFLQVDSTGTAAASSGFFIAPGTKSILTAPATSVALGWVTIMAGTAILYIPAYPSTGTA